MHAICIHARLTVGWLGRRAHVSAGVVRFAAPQRGTGGSSSNSGPPADIFVHNNVLAADRRQ